MRQKAQFELCADSVEAARVADTGGADRVELCVNLDAGGTTPPLRMTEAVVRSVSIPVHVLIRPRAGDFVYAHAEFARMKEEIHGAREAGATGVVFGVLQTDGRVDVMRTRELVAEAGPMKVTFHRAFDETPEPCEALEAVIATGAEWLLTSGGKRNVTEGSETLARLVRQAGSRICVMAGGDLRLDNMVEIIRATGVSWVHGSLMRRGEQGGWAAGNGSESQEKMDELKKDVRQALKLLQATALLSTFLTKD